MQAGQLYRGNTLDFYSDVLGLNLDRDIGYSE
jgi:hypothetical protein